MRVTTLVATVTCVLAGCARTVTLDGIAGTSRTVLTSEQLTSTNSSNVYDAIAKLQPDWLSSRGPSSVTDATSTVASVFMNGSLLGRVDYLRQVNLLDVTEVRYWDTGRASARFGMGHPRGVIELIRR